MSAYTSIPTPRVEDLPEPLQLLLQLADALQPTREPVQVENDPPSFWVNILHPSNNPVLSQSGLVIEPCKHG
jgi:hypothetical protein